jgi:hypothetical protein
MPHEPGQPHTGPLLPDAEELFGPDRPERSPAEVGQAIMRHSMGLADAPPELRPADGPDVSAIREELGL